MFDQSWSWLDALTTPVRENHDRTARSACFACLEFPAPALARERLALPIGGTRRGSTRIHGEFLQVGVRDGDGAVS